MELANEKNIIDPEAPIVFGNIDSGKTYWFNSKKLVRPDLNDIKEELEHLGCTNCNTRFSDKDMADTKEMTLCPLCMTKTIDNLTSIMYNTDYELPEKTRAKKRVIFQTEQTFWKTENVALNLEELAMVDKLEGIEWKQKEKLVKSPTPFKKDLTPLALGASQIEDKQA